MRIRSLFSVLLGLLAFAAAASAAGCGDDNGGTSATGAATAATGSDSGGAEAGAADIKISADPNGQLKFDPIRITTTAGTHTIVFTNDSKVPHDVVVGKGFTESGRVGATKQIVSSKTSTSVDLKPGAYTFYCDVPGHREGGMVGALIVR